MRKDRDSGFVIWFTGLSGVGKSTLATIVKERLVDKGEHVKILDGDEVREFLTADLGFSKEDRDENIRRITYVAKTIADVNGVAIVAAISPYEAARFRARLLIGAERFFEVHLACKLDTLIKRDAKGLYKKALAGDIKNFTGISDPYEKPQQPECFLDTGKTSIDVCVETIMSKLFAHITQ